MNFGVLPEAELEADEAARWYDDQRRGLGADFLSEIDDAFERIRTRPVELSRLETYDGPHDIRRCLLKRFPYLVVLVRRPQSALVVAIMGTLSRLSEAQKLVDFLLSAETELRLVRSESR